MTFFERIEPQPGHRQTILPLNGEWMLCDETAACPSEGGTLTPPCRVGDTYGVRETWCAPFASDGKVWIDYYDDTHAEVPAPPEWIEQWSKHQLAYDQWHPASTQPDFAIRKFPITAITPVQVDGLWFWEITTGDVK